jgi:hypothetical protein
MNIGCVMKSGSYATVNDQMRVLPNVAFQFTDIPNEWFNLLVFGRGFSIM